MSEFDLLVLVPDADYEQVIKTLLSKRIKSLENVRSMSFDILRHPNRDGGTYKTGPELISLRIKRCDHALILLDHEGSGQEKQSVEDMEADLEKRMVKTGWPEGKCAAIVLKPELETWIWSDSGRSKLRLMTKHTQESFQEILQKYPHDERRKPKTPKEALQAVIKNRLSFSPRLFAELAETVSLKTDERAFTKFHTSLQTWFPVELNLPPQTKQPT